MDFVRGKMLIGGILVSTDSYSNVVNPYTKEIVGTAPNINDVRVIDLIRNASQFKSNLNGEQRANILEEIATRIRNNKQGLAELITAELGICITQSSYEVDRSYNVFREAAQVARWIDQEDLTSQYRCSEDKAELAVISEPRRLVVAITPFNHPLNQVSHKLAPAIAAGTPIIIKPSEKTPLTALYLGELVKDLVPAYMVNIITTNSAESVVSKLVTAPKVEGIFFTGGVDVGKKIQQMVASGTHPFKKVVYELGGSAPLVILDDADLDLAAKLALGAFDNSGQRCTAVRRIIVENNVAAEFLDKFVEKTRNWKYGDPLDPTIDMGTVVNEDAAKKIQERVASAIRDGATTIHGNLREGALYSPTILDYVNPFSDLVKFETFGPVAPIIRANSFEEAAALAAMTDYALAAAVVTRSKEKAELLAKTLRVGQFNWNGKPGYRTEQAPFGGRGWSGEGKEGVIEAVRAMRWTRTQYTHK